jgi:hypothetical protein
MSRRPARAWLVEVVVATAGAAILGWAWRATPDWFAKHLLRTYSYARWEERWLAHAIRGWGVLCGLTILILLRPWASTWAARSSRRRLATAFAGLAGCAVGFVAAAELILRLCYHNPLADVQMPSEMARLDRELGWSLQPAHTTSVVFRGRTIHYAVDSRGNRADAAERKPDGSAPSALFLGESFAFGWGLDYAETFPAQVGADLGVQVVNLAVPAYGNDQAYARLVRALPDFSQVRAVVSVFLPVQLERNLAFWRPRLAIAQGGRLVATPADNGVLGQLRVRWLWRSVGYRDPEPQVALAAALVRATARRAQERGAEALFVIPCLGPDRQPAERPERWLIERIFHAQGLPCVAVDLGTADLHRRDQHPNAQGARKLARAVVDALGPSARAQAGALARSAER